LITGQCCS